MSEIVVAPFSNSPIRDWPARHFAELIGLVLAGPGEPRVRVVGAPNQRLGANEIVRAHPADRVLNDCGRTDWHALMASIRDAACFIGNNSGLAHIAGELGTPTVCIFGGSHDRREWRPRGSRVVLVSRNVGCSPCQLDHGRASPYDKACLRDIGPAEVAAAVRLAMSGGDMDGAGGARIH